jgi:DNA-directed RNA polymerase specialized sigma24 family protein
MDLDCPAFLGQDGAARCGLPAEVAARYTIESTDGPLECARIRWALREALARLPPGCQRLIGKLIEDPPLTYAQIGASLGIPVGSIGPLRGRCLDRLRADPAIAALIDADVAAAAREPSRPVRAR